MAYITYIEKFKKGNDEYNIKAASAETAIVADRAITADTVDNAERIGNVRKLSTIPTGDDDKYREGLIIENAHGKDGLVQGKIELNNKGNLAVESLDNHVNIEAKKQIKMKPTTKMILDSSRKVEAGKGNEFEIEAVNDDLDTNNQEKWSELKIKSRNIDLRCNNHGGIALQIAGEDGDGNENKIKFESDRTNSISEEGAYNGEGGKGLEFGTFNNLHSSLYTGDYRFRGKGLVYGVTREAPVQQGDKTDYITQTGSSLVNDFKDPINESTPRATWNQIIDAANKCVGKDEVASIQDVAGMIAEASIPDYTGTTEHLATQEYVQNYVNEHGGGSSYEAGNGIHIEDNTISVNNYSNIEPLTALTDNTNALKYVKIGGGKGNFQIDVIGEYTYEAKVNTVDEYGNEVEAKERIKKDNITNESYYTNPLNYYYVPSIDTVDHNGQPAYAKEVTTGDSQHSKTFVCKLVNGNSEQYNISNEIENSFYRNKDNDYYMAKKGAKFFDENGNAITGGTMPTKDVTIVYVTGMTTEAQKEAYANDADHWKFDNVWKYGVEDENGNKTIWPSGYVWEVNEININLETDSKIKFNGKKIETTWEYPEVEGGKDIAHKMSEISLSAEDLIIASTNVSFEKKYTKNGDFTDEPTLHYEYNNKLLDDNVQFDEFKARYIEKHPGTTMDDTEIHTLYDKIMATGPSYFIDVKVSDLLKLVSTVAELETRIAALESQLSGE